MDDAVNMNELDSVLSAVENSDELADLAQALTNVSDIASRAENEKKKIKARIIAALDNAGLDAAVAGGRRLGFTTKTYYGLAEGDSPDAHKENLRALKEWLEAVAPEVNVPASTNIGKAAQAYLDSNPDAELPPFVKVTETRSLTNRQAR